MTPRNLCSMHAEEFHVSNQRWMLVLSLALCAFVGCARNELPPLVSPVPPRRSLDAQYTRLRLSVLEASDRTSVAGGVVETGDNGGDLKRAGQYLIAPPTRDVQAVVSPTGGVATTTDRGAPGAPLSLSTIGVGGGALSQTIAATLQSLAALSDRFEVVTTHGKPCDLRLRTWVTGVSQSELYVEQVLESCDFGSAIGAVNGTIRFSLTATDILLDRDQVKSLLKKVIGVLPEPAEIGRAQILAREGHYVTINMGKEQKVMRGMKAFAVTYGDRTVDDAGVNVGDEVYTGDLYVFAVYPKKARAWIVTEPADRYHDHSKVRVGDYVIFK
jgi:hypothetical protein